MFELGSECVATEEEREETLLTAAVENSGDRNPSSRHMIGGSIVNQFLQAHQKIRFELR